MLDTRRRTDKIARLTDPTLNWASRVATVISGVCLVVIIAVLGWLVFGRYVLNSTPTWAEQVSLLLIVVITFLSAAVGVRENTHLSVTFLSDMLPAGPKRIVRLLSDLVMAVFGAILTWQAIGLASFGWSTNIPLLDLPEGLRNVPVAVAGVLICIFALVRALRRVAGAVIDEDDQVDPETIVPGGEPDRKD